MNGGNILDNTILRTEWFDETEKFCEIRLDCETKYLTIYQVCYIFEEKMSKVYIAIDEYIKNEKNHVDIVYCKECEFNTIDHETIKNWDTLATYNIAKLGLDYIIDKCKPKS